MAIALWRGYVEGLCSVYLRYHLGRVGQEV